MTHASRANGGGSPEKLRAEVEHAREQLADTVSELTRKTDVKALARERVAQAKAKASGKAHETGERVRGKAAETRHQTEATVQEGATQVAQKGRGNAKTLAAAAAGVVVAVTAGALIRQGRLGSPALRGKAGTAKYALRTRTGRKAARKTAVGSLAAKSPAARKAAAGKLVLQSSAGRAAIRRVETGKHLVQSPTARKVALGKLMLRHPAARRAAAATLVMKSPRGRWAVRKIAMRKMRRTARKSPFNC